MRSQDMHQQVQEIQELLSETDDQKMDEAQASGAEGVEEETDGPEGTPEATPQPTVTPEAAEKPQDASATAVKAAENNGQAAPTSAAQENANSTENTESQQTTTTSETDQHTISGYSRQRRCTMKLPGIMRRRLCRRPMRNRSMNTMCSAIPAGQMSIPVRWNTKRSMTTDLRVRRSRREAFITMR